MAYIRTLFLYYDGSHHEIYLVVLLRGSFNRDVKGLDDVGAEDYSHIGRESEPQTTTCGLVQISGKAYGVVLVEILSC
jgi:hypothetical protein